MTVQTRAVMKTAAQVVRNETVESANTCERVGGLMEDMVDSMALADEALPQATAVATSNVGTLSGLTTVVDGKTLDEANVHVALLTAESNGVNNGLWVVQSGPWTRPDCYAIGSNAGGALVVVQQGTTYAESRWLCTSDDPDAVVDTDATAWQRLTGDVSSVFGRTGDVLAAASDYDASQVDNDSSVTGTYVSDALNTLHGRVPAVGAQHTVLTSTGSAGAWALLTNNNIDASAAIAVSKLAGGGTGEVLYSTGSAADYASGVTIIDSETAVKATHFDSAGTVAASGGIRIGTSWTLKGLNTSSDTILLYWSSPTLQVGEASLVTTANIIASASTALYVGANPAVDATAIYVRLRYGATRSFEAGNDTCLFYYGADVNKYGEITATNTTTTLRRHESTTTANIVSGTLTAVTLGQTTQVATTAVAASTTINNYIGANVALAITAAGLTAKVGAATGWELTSAGVAIANQLGVGGAPSSTIPILAVTTGQFSPSDGNAYVVLVQQSGGTPAEGAYSTGICFTKINSTRPGGAIAAVQTSSDEDQVGLSFLVHTSASSSDELVEAMRITHAGEFSLTISGNTALAVTASGVFVYNQADVNDYLQIASLDTYSYIYRRTNTGGAQTVFGCSTTAVDLGATTGVATTTLNASTTIASAIGGNRVTSATSDGFRVYNQSAVTKYANFTLDSAGLLVTMAAQTGETSALDIEIRGGDSVYPSDPGDVIIRPGVNSGDERGTLYLCGYPMSGIEVAKGAGSNSSVKFTAVYHGFFSATPIAKPTVTGSRGGNAALASALTELANLGLITDSTS